MSKKKYPDWLMSCLRQRFGIEPNDPRFDSVIEKYSPQKVVDEYLMWQGIIGWTPTILNVVETAYGISLPYEVE
jgi:hypothetical protein